MLTAPVFYPPLGTSQRSDEKTRLTADRKLKRSGYGSVLSSHPQQQRRIHQEALFYDGAEKEEMASDLAEVETQVQTQSGELKYRRISTNSILLPKEVWYRRIRLPGILRRPSPHSNAVHTTKYTIINFIFKNLWEQFHRFANLFFLFIVLLNFIPELEVFGKEIGPMPLLFVLTATAVKDIFEDYRRYRSDREVNSRLCRVYDRDMKAYVQRRWEQVKLGDVVELECDEFIPADLLLLATSDPNSICYIETANIDGETNLKQRVVVPGIVDNMQSLGPMDHFDPSNFTGELFAEQPHSKISQFNGYVDIGGGRRLPVDRSNLLLRGCVLRNTNRVAGLIVYAGHQTKALLNNSGPRAKRSKLEKDINIEIFFQLSLLLIVCLIGAIGSGIWTRQNAGKNITYFPFNDLDPALEGFVRFWSFIIIYQVIVPVSLYVTLEIVKLIQVYFLNWDLDMYYETNDQPFQCRALNITEDLGQIQFVFSDKTGTLTENEMAFRCCSIAGRNYPHLIVEKIGEDEREGQRGSTFVTNAATEETDFPNPPESKLELDVNLLNDLNDSDISTDVLQDFFIVMALCNTVVLSRKTMDDEQVPDPGQLEEWNQTRIEEYVQTITYEAESPDEAALVEAARSYGYALISRSPGRAMVTTPTGHLLTYLILHVLEFDSDRKCMSVVVKEEWSGRILLYSKGADSSIFGNLAHPDTGLATDRAEEEEGREERRESRRELTEQHLTLYAKQGLRTLCMARRVLEVGEYADWVESRREAEVALERRDEKLFRSSSAIECKLVLLGATGIEDRLQDGVPETIESLRIAGMRVWVLTGDKQETAINIGFSSRLISENMDLIKINATSSDEAQEILESRRREFDSNSETSTDDSLDSRLSSKPLAFVRRVRGGAGGGVRRRRRGRGDGGGGKEGREKALVIDGGTLPFVLSSSLRCLFLDVASQCVSVICSRATPIQKASVVDMVKTGLNQMTLAVGDGANDVSMIQTANVGVGIAGREGMQAVMASDFAIGRFRFLEKLLIVHGHWSYSRLARMMLYFFYKNMAFAVLLFWWQLFNAWSGSNPIDGINLTIFNLVYTSLPIILVGVADQDLLPRTLLGGKHFYSQGRESKVYTHWRFGLTVVDAIYQSCAVFFLSYGIYYETDIGVAEFGFIINTVIVIVVSFHLAVETLHWTVVNHVILWGSVATVFIFNYAYTAINTEMGFVDTYWVMFAASSRPRFWFLCLLAPVVCLLPRVIGKVVEHEVFPSDVLLARVNERRPVKTTPTTTSLDEPEDNHHPSSTTTAPPSHSHTNSNSFHSNSFNGPI